MKRNHYLIINSLVFAIGINLLPGSSGAATKAARPPIAGKTVWAFTVTGKVTTDKGAPIPGASVQVKGTSTGVATAANGTFSIIVPDGVTNATLVISSIGFETREEVISGRNTVNIILQADNRKLDEVVILGYGSQKRREVIGSISKIKAADITKVPTTSFADALQGQASGLFIASTSGHPGAAPDIKIRGKGSINLSSSPLFIIDGVPIETGGGGQLTMNGVKPVSPLAMINPGDIESIEVLKDAAATAIYGNRGSNGVIIVTTKSARAGKATTTVTYDGGISRLPYKQNDIYMDSEDYFATIDKAWANSGNTTPFEPSKIINSQFLDEKPALTREEAMTYNTNHLAALTQQNAGYHQFGLNMTRGFEKGGMVFSTNYRNEKGILRNNNLEKFSGRFNLNFSPLKSVTFGVNTNLLYLKNTGVQTGNGKGLGGWDNWPAMMPFFKLYDPNSATGYWAANSGFNALAFSDPKLIRNDLNEYRTITNAFVQWDSPIKGLSLRSEGGVDFIVNNSSYWRSIFLDANAPFNNEASELSVTEQTFNYNGFLTYNRAFGEHAVNITAGAEATRKSSYIRSVSGNSVTSGYPELINPLTLTDGDGYTAGQQYLMGTFARANYIYKDRYIINTSIRRDGHSVLSPDNRFATFYAFGGGWIITDEKFANIPGVSLLKLRGSYGTSGNTALTAEMTQLSMGTSPNRYGGAYLPGATTLGPIGSPGLKWETTASTDLGLDFGFLDDRITGSVAYYNKKVSNLILRGNVPLSAGFTTNAVWENIGSLRNWGWEFDVTSLNIKKGGFTWNTDFNISFNDNRILSLNEFEKGKGAEGTETIRKEGEKLDVWYLAQFTQVDPQKGIALIEQRDDKAWNTRFVTVGTGAEIPMNRSNVEANKFVHSGKTALPTFYGGLNNRFTYKNFDVSVLLAFSGGNWKLNTIAERGRRISDISNIFKVKGTVWEKPGDIAQYPELVYGAAYNFDNDGNPITGTTNFEDGNSDFWLEKADFIRLRNLQIGYSLPGAATKRIGLQGLRFYAGGTNLATITSYTGLDPETNGEVTVPRTITFGFNVSF